MSNFDERQYEIAEKKVRSIHVAGGVLIVMILFLLLCPPLIGLWDRNDIWVGILPLSQFMIFILPVVVGVILMIMYFLEARIIDESNQELAEGGDEA